MPKLPCTPACLRDVEFARVTTQATRMYSCCCGFSMLGIGIFAIVDASAYIDTAKEQCEDTATVSCQQAIEFAAGIIAMTVFLFIAAILIIMAEFHVKGPYLCLPRYFGFLAVPLGRGVFMLSCGVTLTVVGKVYQDRPQNEGNPAPLVVGLMNVGAGFVYIFSSAPCCSCLEVDPLRLEVREIYTIVRAHRSGQPAPAGQQGGATIKRHRSRTGCAEGMPSFTREGGPGQSLNSQPPDEGVPMQSAGAPAAPDSSSLPRSQTMAVGSGGGGGAKTFGGSKSFAPGKKGKKQAQGGEPPADGENPFFGNKHLAPDATECM